MINTDGLTVAFNQPTSNLSQLLNTEFLAAIVWKPSAPANLVEIASRGNVDAFVREWADLHRQRTKHKKQVAERRRAIPALWSRFAFEQTDRIQALVHVLEELGNAKPKKSRQNISSRQKKSKKKADQSQQLSAQISDYLDSIVATPQISSYELLIFCELLSNPQVDLHPDIFWKLWRTTLTAAIELSNNLDEPDGTQVPEDQRLLAIGELPWQTGLLFFAIKGSGKLRRHGQSVLCKSLLDHTDTDGTPQAELLERIPLWLAPLVRSANIAQSYAKKLWDKKAASRFESLVQVIAPLCRPDGKISLSNGSSYQFLSLLQAASQAAGFPKTAPHRNLLQAVTNGSVKKKKSSRRFTVKKSDMPAGQSDWARLACLRSDWSPNANSLVVAHHQEKPLIELNARGKTLLQGLWDIEVTREGKPVSFDDEWSCVCWFSDKDADYLELQMKFDDGLQIDRQLLLSRKEDFVLLADAICGAGPGKIEYTSRLPLNPDVEVESLVESRECVLKGSKLQARAFPLALPEDRVMSTPGGFGLYSGELVLKQVSAGEGLYAPVLIDWSPRRKRTTAEWRTLTVTEVGRIVRMGEAAGHRLLIGNHQLLIYRSLHSSDEYRSVLGHHTNFETVIGEFDTTGEVSPLVVVE